MGQKIDEFSFQLIFGKKLLGLVRLDIWTEWFPGLEKFLSLGNVKLKEISFKRGGGGLSILRIMMFQNCVNCPKTSEYEEVFLSLNSPPP